MSRYATNFVIDEITGKRKLIKRLNKTRVDRGGWNSTPGRWNKSGNKARQKRGGHNNFFKDGDWIGKGINRTNINKDFIEDSINKTNETKQL